MLDMEKNPDKNKNEITLKVDDLNNKNNYTGINTKNNAAKPKKISSVLENVDTPSLLR